MDRMKTFFNSHWFDAHYKTRVHIGQIVLVILIIGLSGARVATKPSGIPTSRSDTIAITMVRTRHYFMGPAAFSSGKLTLDPNRVSKPWSFSHISS